MHTPFGDFYDGYDYQADYEERQKMNDEESLEAKIYSADKDSDLLDSLKAGDDSDNECSPSSGDSFTTPEGLSVSEEVNLGHTSESLPREINPGKRIRRLSVLAKDVACSGKLLLPESQPAFTYQEEGGYFKAESNLTAFLANFFPTDTTSTLSTRDLQEIESRISWNNRIRCNADTFNPNPILVNLENGVFNLDNSELMPHEPSFRFTYQVKAEYLDDFEISCPEFERFCQTSLDGDPNKRQLLLEFIGYICTDTNNGKCAMFLKGQPNSGKSVISAFISRLFDPEVISNIPLHQLGDRFFRAELFGKKLNVAGEIAGRALRDISIFKSITGNDRIAAERKGQAPFYFTPRCKLLFSGNTLPYTTETDSTSAFINRLRVLLFNNSVASENQDKGLLDKLWEERNAIVTLALRAVQQLMSRNFTFTLPEDSKQFLASYEISGNLVPAFVEDCCELSPNAQVFNVDLYKAFEDYCAKNGVERLSKTAFYERLSGIPHVFKKRIRMNGENRHGHAGITLKETPQRGTLEQEA